MILQTRTSHHKIVSIASIGVHFFLIPFYFLHTPLHGFAYYNLKFQSMLVSFISQSLLSHLKFPSMLVSFTDFNITCTIVYPIHALQVE